MADVAAPLRPDRRPPAGAPSPRACDCSLAIHLQSTPSSGVRGLKESVPTIDSDRARPLSGGLVIHLVELPGLGKSGEPVPFSVFELAVDSDDRVFLSIDTTAKGIDSSFTGLRSTTGRSLAKAGSAGAKRRSFGTTHASFCGEKHPGLAQPLIRFGLKVLSEKSAGCAQLSAPPDVDGARHKSL
eukprot:6212797-Pleurochrysis_carterae.AAC.1